MTDVPAEDIDYAVENALWVADATRGVGVPTRPYMEVFLAQLDEHWSALQALHAGDPPVEPDTQQATLEVGR